MAASRHSLQQQMLLLCEPMALLPRACRVAMGFVRKYGFDTVRVLRVPINHGKVRGTAGHDIKGSVSRGSRSHKHGSGVQTLGPRPLSEQ